MKIKRIKTGLFLFLFAGFATGVVAQETVSAAGGEATGNDGTVSYTVGQVVYSTNSGTTGVVSEGVQQPFEIYVVTALNDLEGMDLSVLAYPNPTTHFLILEIEGNLQPEYRAALYDFSGKLVIQKKVTASKTEFATGNLVSATYLLKVSDGNHLVKTFKIIKN
jgi:hypothetical protein